MIVNYNSLRGGRDIPLKNDVGDLIGSPPRGSGRLKYMWSMVMLLLVLTGNFVTAQTTLISPTGDGGFENGSTLTANGWTAVNASTDGWVAGAVPVAASGANCGYVSANGGTAWTYSQLSTFTHIYKDVTVPVGESKLALSFKWKATGEGTTTSDWDNLKVFIAPVAVVPTTSSAVSGGTALSGPGAISGMYKLSSASWNNETIIFSIAPGTYRLIFSWKSDSSTIANPPAAVDDISLVSYAPGTITSATSGNWSAGTTWVGGVPPISLDSAIIADGHTVTIDASGLSINNLTVGQGASGVLTYGSTPSSFAVNGNLAVAAGGTLNVFQNTTGKTLNVAGSIANNGTMNFSVGTGVLVLNGSAVQTVDGTGSFTGSLIGSLTFNNSNTATPNINWNFNNISVGSTLTFTAGRVALGSNKLTLGTGTTAGTIGTLSYTAGGFTSGKFNRYWTGSGSGSTVTAGSDPSASGGRFPFVSASGQQRSAFIERTTSLAAGQLSCTYVDAPGMSTVSIADGAYTVERRYDGNWTFSTEGSGYNATSNEVALMGTGAYIGVNGNSRIVLASATAGGTHQNGTTTPAVQRVLSVAQLTAGPLYIGAANVDIVQPCSGTPTPGSIASATQTICGGATPAAITAAGFSTGVTGIALQWEESDDNGVADAWANVVGGSGATSATFTPPVLSATRYYRLKVTCNGSGLFAYTNVATINTTICTFDVVKSAASFTSIASTGSSITSWKNGNATDDNLSNSTPIGFNFFYKGATYANVLVSTNGFITFNTGTSANGGFTAPYNYENNSLFTTSSTSILALAPFYDDLVCAGNPATAAGLQASIKYQTTGSAPNRVFTVEWVGAETFNNPGPNLNFQVKLYETTNVIEYVYGAMELFNGTANYGYSYSIGLTGATMGSTPTVVELQAQQVDNVQSFSNLAKNNLDRFVDCNVKYTFTPGNYSAAASTPVITNDEPVGAIALNVNTALCTSYCGTYYTTDGATQSAGITACSAGTPGTADDDVWFKFTTGPSVADHVIKILGGGGFNSVVQLFSDAGVTSVGCVNATAEGLTETLTASGLLANTTYYVRVYHSGTGSNTTAAGTGNTTSGGVPDFSICVSLLATPPVNDNPCGAVALTPSLTCTPFSDTSANSTTSILNATTTSTNGVVSPTCSGAGATVNDVWFKFTATSVLHAISVTPVTGFDAAFQLYTVTSGTCGGSNLVLSSSSCTNNNGVGLAEQLTMTTVIGQEYYVRVYRHPSGIAGAPVSNSQFSICLFNPTPVCTTNSSPSNAATNVSVTPTLSWSSATNATNYDVYLGTASGPTTLLGNSTTTSYTLTAGQALTGLTQYFWYVVPKNSNGAATCGAANETSFTTLNTCLTPSGLAATATLTTEVNLSWTAPSNAPANGYQYEIRMSGAAGSGAAGLVYAGTTVAGDTTDTYSSLSAQTTYTYYVRGVCGVSSFSAWTSGFTFTTPCNSTDVPYVQDFESVTTPALPICTTVQNVGSGNSWTTASNPGNGFTTKTLRYSWNGSNAANVWFYTQGINLTAGKVYVISYDYGNNDDTYDESLKVAYGSSASAAAMTNVLADHPAINDETLHNNTVVFTAPSTGVFYFGFQAYSIANQFYLFVDNISIKIAPPTIASFTPASICTGSSAQDRTVVITGTLFTGVTGVAFNGTAAESYNVDSNTQITAVVPASATTGAITVTTADGTASSATSLTVNINPTVANITAPDDATNICLPDTLALSNATPTGVWSSSDVDVATVNTSGVVTSVAAGNVVISYTVTDAGTGCSTVKTYALTISEPVSIVSSTPTQTVVTGGNTSFAVNATGTGTPALTYAWEVCTDGSGVNFEPVTNGGVYSGADTATLLLTDVPAEYNLYFYQCTITGVCNAVISDLAVLFVGETGIETQPANATICDSGDGNASFSVVASADVTTYQWQEDQGGDMWTDLTDGGMYSGVNSATLNLSGLTLANNGWRYKCIVNGIGTAESNPGVLTVIQSVMIDTPPTNQTVCYTGGSASFSVAASGGVASYLWQYSSDNGGNWNTVANASPAGASYTGINTATLNVTTTAATPAAGTYLYRAIVNSAAPCSPAASNSAQLVINTPTVTGQPAAASILAGSGSASFTVAANTIGAPTYQWQYATAAAGPYADVVNGTPAGVTYANQTTATLSVTVGASAVASAARYYRAVVSSPVGCSVNSNGGQLTITNYCLPTYSAGPGTVDQIANVSVGTLNNPTGPSASPFYTMYDNVTVPDLIKSTTANVSVTFGNDTTNYCGIWIDFNQNGTFEASEGFLSTSSHAGTTTANGTSVIAIPIPANAVLGKTRMRVRGGEDVTLTTAQACGASSDADGEAEDYFVNIIPLPDCSGTPVAGTVGTPSAICVSGAAVLSVTGTTTNVGGIGYQWYNTVSGLISGATNATYTTPVLTANASYYVKVTCASSGLSADSNTVTVVVNNPQIVTFTPATRCGTGTVNLSATASAGSTVKWYTASTGGLPIATGNTFTTPSISTSTNYYVAAETGATTGQVGTATTLTGATDQPTAFCNRFSQYRGQYVFTAAELQAAGISAGAITAISFNITTLGDSANNANFTVKMGTTASSTLTTTFVTGLPTVFGPATYTHAVGVNKINFTTPFNWDGTSNVIVEVSHSGANATNNAQTYYTATPGNTVLYSISASPTTGTTSTNRLNIAFEVLCASPRTTVAATVNTAPALTLSAASATICSGTSTGVVNISSNVADYDNYVWTPSTGVSGSAAAGYTFNPTTTTTYTLNASQTGGGQCVNSATYTVTVNPTPNTPVITPSNTTICNGDIVPLSIGSSSLVNTVAIIGTGTTSAGTTSYPNPFSAFYGGVKHQMLVTATELTAQGLTAGSSISAVSFNINAFSANKACADFTIRMGATTLNALTGFVTGTSTVYGPITFTPAATGLASFTFATPYVWDGVSNLIVETVHNQGNGGNGSGTTTLNSTTATNTMYYGAKDSVAGGIAGFDALTSYTSSGASNQRPNMRFVATKPLAPSWSPVTGLYTNSGATVPYTGGPAATVYAKPSATVSYTASVSSDAGCPATSAAVTLTVNQLHPFFADVDGDGYGTGTAVNICAVNASTPPAGYAVQGGDCNDAVAAIHPNAVEVPYNGVDDDCDGTIDETGTVTTTLLASSCGVTLTSIGSLVGIQTVGGHNITGYRIRVTNGAQVQVIEKTVPHFTLTQFPSYAYATTYTVDIQLQRAGIWQASWGATCLVSTPAILEEGGAAAVSPSQCGITLPKINTLIATTSLAGVTGYRFRVTNLTDPLGPNAVQTIDRTQNWFSLPMLTRYNFGTTYRIEVAVKTTGAFGGFGSPCEVSSPAVPTLINCGGTVASGTATISATSVEGATQYRFQIVRQSDNASTTIDRSNNWFIFNSVPASAFTAGALYGVRVAVMTKGTWSPFGDVCEITAPGAVARPGVSAETEASAGDVFKATAYPNPYTADFSLNVISSSKENVQLQVYDMLGKLIEAREVKFSELDLTKVGAQYPSGVYNVIVSQEGVVKTLRVIKR